MTSQRQEREACLREVYQAARILVESWGRDVLNAEERTLLKYVLKTQRYFQVPTSPVFVRGNDTIDRLAVDPLVTRGETGDRDQV